MLVLSVLACDRNHPPEIRAMDLPASIAEGEDLEVLVEVADEDGALDLVAGWVEVEGDEVARLQTFGVAGTFLAVAAWDDVVGKVPEVARDPSVGVRVVVTDTGGERVERSGSVRVDCLGHSPGWCSYGCVDLATDPFHCGGCGETCAGARLCADAECVGEPEWTRCQQVDANRIDCDAICEGKGKRCVPGCEVEDHEDLEGTYLVFSDAEDSCGDGGVGAHFVYGGACGTVVDPDVDPIWARCCCQ